MSSDVSTTRPFFINLLFVELKKQQVLPDI